MIEAFHHKETQRIMGIPMKRLTEEEITNATIRELFNNAEKMTSMWRRPQLMFLGRIVRLGNKVCRL